MRADFPIPMAEFAATLLALPDQIDEQEHAVIEASACVRRMKDALEYREGFLIEAGEITGANEKARALQLKGLTVNEREKVAQAQEALDHEARRLHFLQNKIAAYRAAARLIGGSE